MSTLTATPLGDREIRITRAFAAPSRLVWDVHTRPELLKRWLTGPGGWVLEVCTVDLRVGGKARYEMRLPGPGDVMGWTDVFEEITPKTRIVAQQTFDEDWTGGPTTVTTVFRDEGAGTLLEMTVRYASPEAREMAGRSGMTRGMEMGYVLMDRLLAELSG